MTNAKSATEKALDEEKKAAEKLVLKWLAVRKTLSRKDNLEAVAHLGDAEDWGDIEILIVMAHKASGKNWDELDNMSQGELEKLAL